jgi:CRP/FNR family transcriptional regulator, cyclic AMP receptor protein
MPEKKPSTITPATLPEAITQLLPHASERSFRKKSIILSEGDSGDTLLVLLEGSVRVFGEDGRGKEVTYGQIDAPSYFGEMGLDGGPRSASIEALTACRCAVLTRERVRQQLASDPQLAWELLTRIISRARAATDTVRSLALKDAYGRLRDVLDQLASPPDAQGQRPVQSGTTHAALAQRIGTSREMVSKLIRDLELGGYVQSQGRQLVLLKKLPASW